MTLKNLRPLVLLLIIFSTNHCSAQTQQEMNEQAIEMYHKSDKELNKVYQAVLREYKEDTAFIRRFREAQRVWLLFRDAEMLARYPEREPAITEAFTLFAGINTSGN